MSARVIDNPELIGWELDPSTGRWMWTGGSGSGGDGIEEAPENGLIYGRMDATWEEVDHNIEVSGYAPASPAIGQQWFSNADGYLYIWYGAEWVAIGGTA